MARVNGEEAVRARGCFKGRNGQDACVCTLWWGIKRKQRQENARELKKHLRVPALDGGRGMS